MTSVGTGLPRDPPSAFVASRFLRGGDGEDPAVWQCDLAAYFPYGGPAWGGYMNVVLVRAALNEAARRGLAARFPHVVTVSGSVLSPMLPGTAEIAVGVLRQGGGSLVLSIDLRQARSGKQERIFIGTATLADLGRGGPSLPSHLPAPTLPSKDACVLYDGIPAFPSWWPPLDDQERGYAGRGWVEYASTGAMPIEDLAAVTDMLGDPSLWTGGGERNVTLDLQLQIRAVPVAGDAPFQLRSWRGPTTGGRTDWHSEVWDSTGQKVLAIAKQTNKVIAAGWVDWQKPAKI
ncbi:thioesterase-like superfamily-domain-containing protein [Hyaloraphidium curvatum]|nr:thioesterase-like superfamily-domain-containing protein [Hyaloraphidium curvatum]